MDRKKERANNTLDKHIAAGGEHGKKAKEMKDRLNDGGPSGTETVRSRTLYLLLF